MTTHVSPIASNVRNRIAAAVIVLMLGGVPLYAQPVTVDVHADSSAIVMGNWFRYTLDVKHPVNIPVILPQLKDSIGKFSIVKEDSLTVQRNGDQETLHKEFILSAYEPGQLTIPPVTIGYRSGSDTALTAVMSNPIGITVAGVQVDTAQGIKDVKDPLSLSLTWREILLYGGIVFLLAALVYAAFYLYRKFKKIPAVVEEVIPPRAAHIVAFEKLKELEDRRLWQQGEIKAFYSDATEIIREYFERRYEFLALEMTTDEILDQLRKQITDAGMLRMIAELFIDADLVKFAKHTPVASECESVIPASRDIVDRTKVPEVPENDV
ncbi:MAG: BatD family protein [Ignavibacteriales bacterium]|nr:BatD family protein [Ignavibacteriales bacterium]